MHDDFIAQRYKPLFPRARGGFSDVIIAWDTRLARRVAIKRIALGTNTPLVSLEEARTAALLSSPNIVSVYDFEYVDPENLIIMENVDGPSLSELMADSSELLDLDVATTILDGIVSALEYAHENQVLHLDIKPANILIDQSGHIKVSDFGLAELMGSSGFGEVQGGTIGYMPPEQLTAGFVDARTDIWALAALTYQLFTGINPFFALSPRDSLEIIMSEGFTLPSGLRHELDGGVDEILVLALRPQMEDRPASVAEFWAALRPHLGRVSPGRRRLKSLVRVWAGKEAALLDRTDDLNADTTDVSLDDSYDTECASTSEALDETSEKVSLWDDGSEDEYVYDEGEYDEYAEEQWEQKAERKRERAQRRAERRAERKRRKPALPLWQRMSPTSQAFIGRCFVALGAAAMTWLAMSALPYLSDPLAQAATTAANNTGSPVPSLEDAASAAQMILMLAVGVISLIVPGVGAGTAVLALSLGFFFTGNWLLGIVVLGLGATWWFFQGRVSAADASVFLLSPLLALVSIPLLTPLLAGYMQTWRRALASAALSCFVCSLLTVTTFGALDTLFSLLPGFSEQPAYGQFSSFPLEDLLSASPQFMKMPQASELFIPLTNVFTSPEFWLIMIGWLLASVVMSLLNGSKSRVKYVIATLCGTSIVAAGYLLPFFLFVGEANWALFAAIVVRLVIALALCLLLIALGVQPKPVVSGSKETMS